MKTNLGGQNVTYKNKKGIGFTIIVVQIIEKSNLKSLKYYIIEAQNVSSFNKVYYL